MIVVDRAGGSDATGVNILKSTDTIEAPSTPARPTVRAKEKIEHEHRGHMERARQPMGPPITGYDVEYRKGSEAFSDDHCGVRRLRTTA